ncbi:protein kinase [Nocardia sp. NPDC050712]|uniref:serine/threonine-protein kinase n=1 Tax=Nocardia sp. NPDC050712 TaxID=3155518 RepID=UPI0033D952BC
MGDMSFGPYVLQRPLGRGGTGQVWLAHDSATERLVALKILAPELSFDANYRQRFEREAHAAAALRNPHVVPIHRFGEIDDRLYIDMELIEGADVATLLACDGAMTPAVAVELVTQVAAALDAAHRTGLVHRDVKPSNVVVNRDGFAYLIDFGTAHRSGQTAITGTGRVIGTLAYLAPERFTGTGDAGCDVYALACVLYECLTARRPFGDTDPAQQLHAHLRTPPPRAADRNPAVPAALDAVIACGMAKQPDERFSSAGELARAAQAAIGANTGETTTALAAVVAPFLTSRVPEEVRLSWPDPITPATDVHVPAGIAVRPRDATAPSELPPSDPPEAGDFPKVGESPESLELLESLEPSGSSVLPGSGRRSKSSGPSDSTGQVPGPRRVGREWLLAGVTVALLVAAGAVLWSSEQPDEVAETSSAATSSELPPVREPAPMGAAPWSAPTTVRAPMRYSEPVVTLSSTPSPLPRSTAPVVPAIGQPCDPAFDTQGISAEGIPLSCSEIGGKIAIWSLVPTLVESTNNGKPIEIKPDNSGHGNGHGNNGNGNGKPKPRK